MKQKTAYFLMLFLPGFILYSCEDNDISPHYTEYDYYLVFDLDGEPVEYVGDRMSVPGVFSYGISTGFAEGSDTVRKVYTSICRESSSQSWPQMSFSLVDYVHRQSLDSVNNAPDFAYFESLFYTGDKSFIRYLCLLRQKGIYIEWQDENMTKWSTPVNVCADEDKPVNPDYDNFIYRIESVRLAEDPDGEPALLVESQFSCALYNQEGDSLVVENGKARSLFRHDL